MKMPIIKRRYFIGLKLRENDKRANDNEKSSTGGKGSRTTRLTGDALKSEMVKGKVPLV